MCCFVAASARCTMSPMNWPTPDVGTITPTFSVVTPRPLKSPLLPLAATTAAAAAAAATVRTSRTAVARRCERTEGPDGGKGRAAAHRPREEHAPIDRLAHDVLREHEVCVRPAILTTRC